MRVVCVMVVSVGVTVCTADVIIYCLHRMGGPWCVMAWGSHEYPPPPAAPRKTSTVSGRVKRASIGGALFLLAAAAAAPRGPLALYLAGGAVASSGEKDKGREMWGSRYFFRIVISPSINTYFYMKIHHGIRIMVGS